MKGRRSDKWVEKIKEDFPIHFDYILDWKNYSKKKAKGKVKRLNFFKWDYKKWFFFKYKANLKISFLVRV